MDADTLAAMQTAMKGCIRLGAPKFGVYELIKQLEAQGLFDFLPQETPNLLLFKKNFLVMHLLYNLRIDYRTQGYALKISTLDITLTALSNSQTNVLTDYSSSDLSLGEFYGDLEHFQKSTAENVEQLLNNFWVAFAKRDDISQALSVLNLPADASWSHIQKSFRRLAQQHHPDKGGDAAQFAAINAAYNQLKAIY